VALVVTQSPRAASDVMSQIDSSHCGKTSQASATTLADEAVMLVNAIGRAHLRRRQRTVLRRLLAHRLAELDMIASRCKRRDYFGVRRTFYHVWWRAC